MPFHQGRSKNLYTYLHLIVLLASLFLHPLYGYPTSENTDISYLLVEKGVTSPADEEQMTAAELITKLISAVILVLLGGIFAGLTIGLMGLDETNLQVLVAAGEEAEREYAQKVLDLLNHGKHWVLVTLLLSNVIVNESLPIIMDSVFGGGWPAVLISTALIVLFGEIIPQAVCVRHGLAIGAWSSSLVLFLMYIMYPVARPIAELLDHCLGEHHGTMYRKSELKTFVSLHKNGGIESLNEDEVTIISAVLELCEKPVSAVMTPMADVYTLSSDHILDQATVDEILKAGYSRIPIYARPNPTNFIGMLLVKKLISYDPEDELPVKDFHLSSLPETSPDTSCLDILNFFQEGRSHMVLVSDDPGGDGIALGVITLEDVIEELIGEEIVDETDVYIDVHTKVEVVRRPPRHVRSRFFPKRQANYDVSKVGYTANALQLGLSTSIGSLGNSVPKVSGNNQQSSKDNLFLQIPGKTMGQPKSAEFPQNISSAGDDNIDKNNNNIDHSQTSSIGNYGSTENERDSFATGKPSGEILERASLLKK